MYYLQSRYYDPEIGRFINADDSNNLGSDMTILSYTLFVYCGNNPVTGCDPTGRWNWGGVLVGVGLVLAGVAIVASAGAATPLVAVAAGSLIATGTTTAYAAATDSAMVVDVSWSTPISNVGYLKNGVSVVIDFESNSAYSYPHTGGGVGRSTGASYSVGLVDNFHEAKSYSGSFIDVNAGSTIGIDHCWAPSGDYRSTVKATSVEFSFGHFVGAGYDYYGKPNVLVYRGVWQRSTT